MLHFSQIQILYLNRTTKLLTIKEKRYYSTDSPVPKVLPKDLLKGGLGKGSLPSGKLFLFLFALISGRKIVTTGIYTVLRALKALAHMVRRL